MRPYDFATVQGAMHCVKYWVNAGR